MPENQSKREKKNKKQKPTDEQHICTSVNEIFKIYSVHTRIEKSMYIHRTHSSAWMAGRIPWVIYYLNISDELLLNDFNVIQMLHMFVFNAHANRRQFFFLSRSRFQRFNMFSLYEHTPTVYLRQSNASVYHIRLAGSESIVFYKKKMYFAWKPIPNAFWMFIWIFSFISLCIYSSFRRLLKNRFYTSHSVV